MQKRFIYILCGNKEVKRYRFILFYDVCSLFTSIPLKETIDKELFEFATSGTHFLFHGTFYDQIDGVAGESPLGSVLANLFIGYYETLWLNTLRIM